MPRRSPGFAAALLVVSLAACASERATVPADSGPADAAPSAEASASPTEEVPTAEVTVAGGKVTRKSSTFEVKRGQRARIVVTSDRVDEVHLHTYDVKVEVTPGAPSTLEFLATIPGQFEVELEHAGLLLLTVAVR